MPRLARATFLLALGIYIGIGVAIVLAAPAVFGSVTSRTAAGDAFAAVLRNTTVADLVLSVLMVATGVIWIPRTQPGLRRTLTAAALALLLGLIGYYKFGITPAMQEHRRHVDTFDSAEVSVHRASFDALHVRYVRVYTAALAAALVGFAFAVGLPPVTAHVDDVAAGGAGDPPA